MQFITDTLENIIDQNEFKKFLKELAHLFFTKSTFINSFIFKIRHRFSNLFFQPPFFKSDVNQL